MNREKLKKSLRELASSKKEYQDLLKYYGLKKSKLSDFRHGGRVR